MSSPDRPDADTGTEGAYVESQVIMTTVRVVAPFSMTYGLFMAFHGATSPGGSFQGGTIVGATVLMIAFAFGIQPTREWLRNRTVVTLVAGGVVAFATVGLVPMLFGGAFLEHPFYQTWGIDTKWGLEAIELVGVAPIVTGVVVGLFFVIGRGYHVEGVPWFERSESTDGAADGAGDTAGDSATVPDGGTPRAARGNASDDPAADERGGGENA